jgi:hypothetical protein
MSSPTPPPPVFHEETVTDHLAGDKAPHAPLTLFILWLAWYTLTASGRITPGDEETMFQVTERLATHGKLDITRKITTLDLFPAGHDLLPTRPTPLTERIETTSAVPGSDGTLYSKYGLGQSLAALPLWLTGYGLSWLAPELGTPYATRFAASFLTALATALTAWFVADAGLALGYRLRTSLMLSVVYGLATMAWPYSKNWYSEPAVTALVLLAFTAGVRGRQTAATRQVWLSGAAVAVAILFRITSLLWLPAFVLLTLWPGVATRRRRAVALLAPCLLAISLTAVYNTVRFGLPWSFGYHEAKWQYPPLDGILGLLVLPGKGLFFYNPPLLVGTVGLALWLSSASARKAEGATVAALVVLTLAYLAPYNGWHGAWNWGPRFLLPLAPLLLLPAGALLESGAGPLLRGLWVGLCVLGLVVNLPAVLVDHSRHLNAAAERDPDFYPRSVLWPAYSPVWWQWPSVVEVGRIWNSQRTQLAQELRHYPPDEIGVLQREELLRLNAPDFWQVHWYLLGLPLWLPGLMSGLCLTTAAWAGCRLRSLLQVTSDMRRTMNCPANDHINR